MTVECSSSCGSCSYFPCSALLDSAGRALIACMSLFQHRATLKISRASTDKLPMLPSPHDRSKALAIFSPPFWFAASHPASMLSDFLLTAEQRATARVRVRSGCVVTPGYSKVPESIAGRVLRPAASPPILPKLGILTRGMKTVKSGVVSLFIHHALDCHPTLARV